MRHLLLIIISIECLSLFSCTKKIETPAAQMTPEQLIEHGKSVYTYNCLSCHGPDPKQDGAVGPALAGSPIELITSRVMRLEYPAGYKPKRNTSLMVALPHLEKEIPALHAYLNSLK